MKNREVYNRLLNPGLILGIFIGAATGVAMASIPDSGGVIHGCYRNLNGNLRVIDSPSQNCNNLETPISWNQTGLQGPAGPVGPQGPAGASSILGFVKEDGTLDTTRSSSKILSVEHASNDTFCFQLDFTPKHAFISSVPQGFISISGDNSIIDAERDSNCTSPSTVEATVVAGPDIGPPSASFYVQFFE